MSNKIHFELSEYFFMNIINALEEYTETLDDYADIAEMVTLINVMLDQYDKNAAEVADDIKRTFDNQMFYDYLKEGCDKETRKWVDECYKMYCMKSNDSQQDSKQ